MFIEHEPQKVIQAPSGAAWFEVECVAMTVFVVLISMPLLTELVSIKAGFSYKHGAPNGAVTDQHRIPPETAKNQAPGRKSLGR